MVYVACRFGIGQMVPLARMRRVGYHVAVAVPGPVIRRAVGKAQPRVTVVGYYFAVPSVAYALDCAARH